MAVLRHCPKCSACIYRDGHSGYHSLRVVCILTNRTYFSCTHLYLRIHYGRFLLEQGCNSFNGEQYICSNDRVLFPGNDISLRSICTVWCPSLRSILGCISTRNSIIYTTKQIFISIVKKKQKMNESILITGANNGLGKEAARQLALKA